MRAWLFLPFGLMLAGAVFASEFSSLEERMSDADFKAAGLEKLSAEELSRLNAWIRSKAISATDATTPSPSSDRRGFVEPEDDFSDRNSSDTIVSRIDGEFNGWKGSTTFRLTNGQVWRTTETKVFRPTGGPMPRPQVTLKRALVGDHWFLKVEGHNSSVRVTRVE